MTASVKERTRSALPNGKNDMKFENGRRNTDEKGQLPTGAKSKCCENPFKLPKERDYTKLLQEDRQNRQLKFKKMLVTRVQLKTPARRLPYSKVMSTLPPLQKLEEKPPSPTSEIKNDPFYVQAVEKGEKLRNMENLSTFINNKREMFLIKYMIGINRDENIFMVKKDIDKEAVLTKSETVLENDAIKFSDYLRLNDRAAIDGAKQAEVETRVKLDKSAEIKKLNVLIVMYKSKISKLEDILQEFKTYAKFLNSVAPQEWIERKRREKILSREKAAKHKAETTREQEERYEKSLDKGKRITIIPQPSSQSLQNVQSSERGRRSIRKAKEKSTHGKGESEQDDHGMPLTSFSSSTAEMLSELQLSSDMARYLVEDEEEENVEIYFTSPSQLPTIFADLEERNLLLIQKSQETEDLLEEVLINFKIMKKTMVKETHLLQEQVEMLERLLTWEVKKGKAFEVQCKLYSYGQFEDHKQEVLLSKYSTKIEEVYTKAVGPNDANLNALHMMTSIENKLELLMENLERLPPAKVAAALTVRARERHKMARIARALEMEEYLQQRRKQTIAKAMEIRPIYHGRKPVARSRPPAVPTAVVKLKHLSREEDELLYFFT